MKKGRILSGIQPTGNFHIGNYFGAVHQWIQLQNDYECLFCVVDLHAINTSYNPNQLQQHTREIAAVYIAAGLNPEECVIFPQSSVSAHAELSWVLGCFTPLGWLNRMTQFKDKAGKHKDQASLGLYSYPVLMAADILAYKATHVPVGEDQKQHLELARDIAGAFNRFTHRDIFPLPEVMIQKQGARIMSLRDGSNKMSKSDPAEGSRINLKDDNETIAKKIRKAKTDPHPFPSTFAEAIGRPDVENLITIYSLVTQETPDQVCNKFAGSNFSPFKQELADAAVHYFTPIREKFYELMQHPDHIDKILEDGANKARTIADKTRREIYNLTGLYGPQKG